MRQRRRTSATARRSVALALAAPEVIARRTLRMWLAGPHPSKRDRDEAFAMTAEKIAAFNESWTAMWLEAMRASMRLAWSPWWWAVTPARAAARLRAHGVRTMQDVLGAGLVPVHRRAVANAKRLRKAR